MRTKLIAIGNSRGLRLPKTLVEQYGLAEGVELELLKDHVILRATSAVRSGWDAAFARMAERGDDALIHGESATATNEFDRKDWTW